MKAVTGKFLKAGTFLVLIIILGFIFVLQKQFSHLVSTSAYVAHTNKVLYNTQKVLSAATEIQIGVRDYLLTGSNNGKTNLESLRDSLSATVTELEQLTADNAVQQRRVDSLRHYIDENFESSLLLMGQRGQQGAAIVKKTELLYFNEARRLIHDIENEETVLLTSRENARQMAAARLNNLLLALIVIVIILIIIVVQTVRFDFFRFRKEEKKRRESEEQLQLLLANVKDYAIFITDTRGNIQSWNGGAEKIKGYTRQDVVGNNISMFYTADKVNGGEPEKNLDKARQAGHYETEGWRVRKDGTMFLANNVFTALYNHKQQLKGFAEITRDITEQKKKQDEISYLSNLVEQTSDAIISTDENFIIKSWNRAAEKLYGYSRQQAIGKHSGTLINSQLTDDQRSKALQELQVNGYYNYETSFTHKNGHAIFVLSSVTSIKNDQGLLTGYVGTHRDITERKRLEQQLQLFNETLEQNVKAKTAELTGVFERITDAFVAFDSNWCYTYVNKKAGELFRRNPESLIGKNIWEEFPDTRHTQLYSIFHQAFREQQFHTNAEYFPPLGRWLENYIYPSPEGLSVFIKDISDRKKAEEAIIASNERVEIIANATNDAVWDWDLVKHSIWWNKNYFSHYGYSPAESTPVSSRYNGIHPEDRARIAEYINRAIESGAPTWSGEYRFLKADGTPVFVLDRGYIMYDEKKRPVRMTGAMVDVTSIRKAEEKIINNEKRFRALLQNSADGLLLTDANGIILSISPTGARIYGYSSEELAGTRRPEFVHPDDLQKVGDAFSTVADTPGAISLVEYRHRLPGGHYHWLECSFNNLLHEPFVNAMVLNFRDITERKHAEERVKTNEQMLSRGQEIGQFGSWEYDMLTQAIKWSDSMYHIHGVDKEKAVSLEYFFQLLHPDDVKKVKTVFKNLPETKQRSRDEYRFYKGQEGLRYALSTIDSVFENGQLVKAIGVVQDITERKKAEEVLLQSEARYRKAQAQGKLGHWELDVRSQQLFLSDEIYAIYHLQPGCLPNGYNTFNSIIHPDDRAAFEKEMQLALSGQKTMDIVHRIVRKDGTVQYIHEIAELVKDDAGHPLRLTGMAQDITDQRLADENLRRSEHKYRLLFENNPMPMWMSSIPQLNIIDVNEAALKQYGYSREEFLRLNSKDLRPEEDAALLMEEIPAGITGLPSTLQWRHKKKDGSIIHVEIFNYRIMYEGKPVWLGLSLDITEKKMAETLLKKSYEDVRQLASHLQEIREEERANMAREIHDELGQQLTGLKMDISWLGRRKDIDAAQRDQKIKEILSFLDGTVNTVRKLSSELRPSILDDLGLVEALEWWSTEFEKRSGVPCSFTGPGSPLQVSSSLAIGLFRIFQESLTNVARHANASAVNARLELTNGRLVLEIKDNGKGFDTGNTSHKKTLGLLGMKERTLMMGGSYEILSQTGKGTTVTISAPFAGITEQ